MSIEKLVELQEIDTKLRDISDLLGDLPSKVEELNQEEESIKETLISDKLRLKELEVEIHKRELDVTQVNEKINKLKDQLFLVTNNKQYDALVLETDHLKEQRDSFETEHLSFLEEKETLTISVTTMESKLGDLTKDLSDRRVKLESAISFNLTSSTRSLLIRFSFILLFSANLTSFLFSNKISFFSL